MVNLFSKQEDPESVLLLVVTHQPSFSQKVVEPLKAAGYEVLVAAHADEVVTVLDHLALPELLIIDMIMPNLDIPHFLETLRLRFGRIDLPPVLLLAPDISSEATANALEVEDFLPEPFTSEDLLTHVQNLLEIK